MSMTNRNSVVVLSAEDLLSRGKKLKHDACRTCGGCGQMTVCDLAHRKLVKTFDGAYWSSNTTKPCPVCNGTGRR